MCQCLWESSLKFVYEHNNTHTHLINVHTHTNRDIKSFVCMHFVCQIVCICEFCKHYQAMQRSYYKTSQESVREMDEESE